MKILKVHLLLIIILFTFATLSAQNVATVEDNRIETVDIQHLTGEWTGTLTYMDYSSNQPFSMPSDVSVQVKRNNRQLVLRYRYPNEPSANSKSKIRISKNRSSINRQPIVSRTQTSDENTQIITEYSGRDGNKNKEATIRDIYIIGPEKFIIRKEVQFAGTQEWIVRNEYNFDRKE